MARPTKRLRDPLSQAVIELRTTLGETQQAFAGRLGVAIATIARYETVRPPSGKALAQLQSLAAKEGRREIAEVFRRALVFELGQTADGRLGEVIFLIRSGIRRMYQPDKPNEANAHQYLERAICVIEEIISNGPIYPPEHEKLE